MYLLLVVLSSFAEQRGGENPGLYVRFGPGLVAAFVSEESREYRTPCMEIAPKGSMCSLNEWRRAWPDWRYASYYINCRWDGSPNEIDVRFADESSTSYLTIALALWRVRCYSQSPAYLCGLRYPPNAVFYFRMKDPPRLPQFGGPAATLGVPVPLP